MGVEVAELELMMMNLLLVLDHLHIASSFFVILDIEEVAPILLRTQSPRQLLMLDLPINLKKSLVKFLICFKLTTRLVYTIGLNNNYSLYI